MAVPKRRTSHSRQGSRRSHHFIVPRQRSYCNQCGVPVLTHRVCSQCGYINTQKRNVIEIKEEKED